MKKLVLKTAFITFGVTLILAVSLFGIVSFCAPAAMMRFCEFLGLENIGGDYAYQEWKLHISEYREKNDLSYLVHAFEAASSHENYAKADDWFGQLYEEEGFGTYCAAQTNDDLPEGVPQFGYRAYLCGRAACVKYHLAVTDDDKNAVCTFAISETAAQMGEDAPIIALAVEAINANDRAFCSLLRDRVAAEHFEETEDYQNLNTILDLFLEEGNEQ